MEPNKEENKIIAEVTEHIRKRYFKQQPAKFEIFEPLTPEWKNKFKYPTGGYAWGDNWSNQIVHLTRCQDRKAFYELVFHEVYRLNTPEGPRKSFRKKDVILKQYSESNLINGCLFKMK